MTKNRLEAFSDGVIAIIITIMVLEMKVPHGHDLSTLAPLLPVFLSYALSYLYLGIYWNNHHHMLHATRHINGAVLWANLHLLFWLSLVPFVTAWMGGEGDEYLLPTPTAFYGFVLLMAALAYWILMHTIRRCEGADSLLARAVGTDWKGKLSPLLYVAAIGAAFVHTGISAGLYAVAALIWVIPDRRIERVLAEGHEGSPEQPRVV